MFCFVVCFCLVGWMEFFVMFVLFCFDDDDDDHHHHHYIFIIIIIFNLYLYYIKQ